MGPREPPERDRMSAAVWTANGQAADSLQANTQIVQSVHCAPPAGHTQPRVSAAPPLLIITLMKELQTLSLSLEDLCCKSLTLIINESLE